MSSLVRGRKAVLAPIVIAVVAILAVSGWLLIGRTLPGRAAPRPSQAAAAPAPPSAQPSLGPSAEPSQTPPAPQAAAVQPARLLIPRLGVTAPIENKGIDTHNQMEAPDRAFDVAWYPFTAKPGSGGNAVFAGHKDFVGVGPAVFWRLAELSPGDAIEVVGADQNQLRYQVTQTFDYTLSTIPMQSVLAQSGGDQITLITCAGAYSRAAGYDHRLVVRARRIA
ncbi:MAG TPA: class F sortase [Candidatus Dormibacteraeota bacterium]